MKNLVSTLLLLSLVLVNKSWAGHYEGTTFEEQSKAGPFYVVPEYFPTKTVLISQSLDMGTSDYGPQYNELGDMKLILEILSSGIEVKMVGQKNAQFFVDTIQSQPIWDEYRDRKIEFGNLGTIPFRVMDDWARDWAPAFLKSDLDKPTQGLMDFNVSGMRVGADEFPSKLAKHETLDRISLPFFHPGGNLVCNSEYCFISDNIFKLNRKDSHLPNSGEGDVVFSDDEGENKKVLNQHFQKYIKQKLVVLKPIPYEPTLHVDMAFQFIGEKTIILSQVRDESLAQESDNALKQKMLVVRDYFVEIEKQLRKLIPELEVIYVPQPLGLGWDDSTPSNPLFGVFRSYANFLVLNSQKRKKIIFPSYISAKPKSRTCTGFVKDGCLTEKYEAEIADNELLKKLGYEVGFEGSLAIIGKGGAVHCITRQVPY